MNITEQNEMDELKALKEETLSDLLIVERYLTLQTDGKAQMKLFLKSMFNFEWTVNNEKIPEYTKAIRQEVAKIYHLIGRLQDGLKQKTSGYSKTGIDVFAGLDIDLFFVKYRTIIDYLIDIAKLNYGEEMKGIKKIEDVFGFLKDKAREKKLSTSLINNSWFYLIAEYRNGLVHRGSNCAAFADKFDIPFQIYKMGLEDTIFDKEYLLYNDANLYSFRYFFVVYMSYLHYFMEELFTLMYNTNKKESTELEDLDYDLGYLTNKEIVLSWTTDCYNAIIKDLSKFNL
ncbi:hypothetical protein COL41_29255 [Bacillus mycoides]|uniref:hypothetical protein n=1 Tax=Bacillus mycoides TaxID=1405 RepID=UPI000BF94846|nr:hypothetical protein [Bacillus mycoides]PFX88248.1 hypothetical protein COL41_29255 [Bacillus mycoides]QWH79138.1 hypothetical protein EXW59_21600 [Bacillus mycoides]QWI44186.1 hypothetical protein EXW55_14855 [Bacillus mycoides]